MNNEMTPASTTEGVPSDQTPGVNEQRVTQELSAQEIRANSRAAVSLFCGIAIEIPALPATVTGLVVNQEKIFVPGITATVIGLGLCAVGLSGWMRDRHRQSQV